MSNIEVITVGNDDLKRVFSIDFSLNLPLKGIVTVRGQDYQFKKNDDEFQREKNGIYEYCVLDGEKVKYLFYIHKSHNFYVDNRKTMSIEEYCAYFGIDESTKKYIQPRSYTIKSCMVPFCCYVQNFVGEYVLVSIFYWKYRNKQEGGYFKVYAVGFDDAYYEKEFHHEKNSDFEAQKAKAEELYNIVIIGGLTYEDINDLGMSS